MATTKPRTLPLSKRGLNFEMFMWLFTRLSALAMYALILFAIIGALVMGARNEMNFADVLRWGFMPNSHPCAKHQCPGPGTLVHTFLEADCQRAAACGGGTWCAWTGRDRG